MNWIQHYKTSRKTEGRLVSLLTPLPDLFPRHIHNTLEGIEFMSKFGLGKPWELHYKQDKASHDQYQYDYFDLVPTTSVMLFSGGLDSFIIWRLLGQPKAVYFAIGHKAQEQELNRIEKIRHDFNGDITIDYSIKLKRYEFRNGYIPYRNLFFLMLASLYSKYVVISQIAEYAPDKNLGFYRHAENLLAEIGTGRFQGINIRPKIYAPFANVTKTKLVRMYLRRWSFEDLTKYTVSCYAGEQVACGCCNGCFQRYVAMTNNNIWEEYATIPSYEDFKKKLDWHDFKFSQIPMYIKRWKELQEFRQREPTQKIK